MDVTQSSLSGLFAGRYTIEGTLGSGATSTVYRARDARTDRPVAIKVLRKELAEALGPERFLREIKLTDRLHHARILPILDSGESEGRLYFVAPYMDGGTLRERLNKEVQLPLPEAVRLAADVADALAYAHRQGFVHRDVKPENILFGDGEVCLADFGIARAIERSTEDVTTSTGIARGTAAYMSPEQASAARDYDGRSDVYSLGCVLYEMIAGMRPFVAATPQAVISQRFLHPPRPLVVYRANVPDALQDVVHRALQLEAADRYRTAAAFADALRALPVTELEKAQPRLPASGSRTSKSRTLWLTGGLAAAIVLVAFASQRTFLRSTTGLAVDTTSIALLPLEGVGGREQERHDDDLLQQAVSGWRGLHVVDEFQVADGVRRAGHVGSTEQAENLVRGLGAGRYIRGRLTNSRDGSHVYLALYQIGVPRALYTAESTLPTTPAGALKAYQDLADSLLLRGADPDADQLPRSKSLPAVQAFARAQAFLDDWDLTGADSAFQAATAFDPEYARASLWLSQVRAWRELARTSWGTPAERAAALGDQLSVRERHLAEALVLLSRGDYARACGVYGNMLKGNERDFAAWFGLGQCRTMDNIVVADRSSPSGWRFRGSVAAAMNAYAKAFEILPSVHRGYERGAFEKLRNLLLVSRELRSGYRLPDSAIYYGRLGIIGDSVVMVAYPWQIIFSGDKSSIPPGFKEALARRRADFRRISAGWSAAFPRNASAKHAVAVALDLLGDPSAIDTLRLARTLESDPERKTKLTAAEVMLLAKFGAPDDRSRLRNAASLADTLLNVDGSHIGGRAAALAPVAALSGRCELLDGLVKAAVSPGGYQEMTASILGEANLLSTRLASGCALRGLTMRRILAESDQSLGKAPDDQRRRIEQMLLYRAVILNPRLEPSVTDHLSASSTDDLLLAAKAIAHGDGAGAIKHLERVDQRVDPGVPTPDITLARARLWNEAGRPADAARVLDGSLNSMVSYSDGDLKDPVNAAALVSMMLLRAEIAAAQSDYSTARRWATAAAILWSGADPELQRQLRQISRFSNIS